jgi:type I restriction enzyme M protein
MALKKSELYSSLWQSCDELRGGMDASQYKDYVLVLLFIKYISDKYVGVPFAPIIIPEGASFKGMVALKGKPDIGDQINKKIIAPLANANLLHIVRSMKSAGKGACILPHGVLFRGHAEADIRRALARKGYIKGIIGLPANLFYGTGIPACIIVVDKEDAHTRQGIFMIDASSGYMKDGTKNRLRAQDIHKTVDVFTRQRDIPKYSRLVSFAEIEKNEFNLNLPRYIDSQEPEDLQDIAGHLYGGIPNCDIAALEPYWSVLPGLKSALFHPLRDRYSQLSILRSQLKHTVYAHPEFVAFTERRNAHFAAWRQKSTATLKALQAGFHPKEVIATLAEALLAHYASKPLINRYDVYQHLMDYWAETMQDDCYLIAADGWKAETYRIIEKGKNGKERDKGWACDLVPKALIVARYFATEQEAITQLDAELESVTARMSELEEEHSGEDGVFSALEKVNRASVTARLKEIRGLFATDDEETRKEAAVLDEWLELSNREAGLKKKLKDAEIAALEAKLAKARQLKQGMMQELLIGRIRLV